MLSLLALFLSLFSLLSHISGSRASTPPKRVSASDVDPLSTLSYTVSGNSTYAFLSTASPGLFLNLQAPRHTSLVKVYGHKRAGAALYGVHLVNGGPGLEIVDGHDPSIPALLDDQPSCIFSLSIDPRKNLSLELYNIYDRRFREYGTITFSFAEYLPLDKAASDIHVHMCRHHIDSFDNTNALVPRGNHPRTPTPPHAADDSKWNTIIGLLSALIVVGLAIFVVVAIYVLRTRRHAVHRRAEWDPEENRNRPLDKSINLASVTATDTLQPRSQDQVYKDQRLQQPRSAVYINPTPVPSRTDLTKQIFMPQNQPRNDPPTLPPKEPIPELPRVPFPPPALQAVRSTGEVLREFPTPPRTQHPGYTMAQDAYTNAGTSVYSTGRATNALSPLRLAEPAQIRNPDMNSTSHNIHSRPKAQPRSRFSKPLPEPFPGNNPLSTSTISHAIVHSRQSSGPSVDPPGYIDICRQRSEVYDEVPAAGVREPSTTDMGINDSNQFPMPPALQYTRSLDPDARFQHQNASQISLERGATITASGWTRETTNSQDRLEPKRNAQTNRHNRQSRIPRPTQATQPDHTVQKASLSVPLSDDPEEWLLYLQYEEQFAEPPLTDGNQTETRRVEPLRISQSSARRTRRSARVEIDPQRASRNKSVTAVTPHQEAVPPVPPLQQDPPTKVHSPRRALPKPPT